MKILYFVSMLSKNDLNELRGIMREVVEENNGVLKREIRDEVHSLIKASEAGLIRRMDEKMDQMKTEILDGVDDIVGGSLLPQIDDLDRRVIRLETVSMSA